VLRKDLKRSNPGRFKLSKLLEAVVRFLYENEVRGHLLGTVGRFDQHWLSWRTRLEQKTKNRDHHARQLARRLF